MTELLHQWIGMLTAAGILAACAMTLSARGSTGRVTRLSCGLLLGMVLFGPLLRLNMDEYAVSLASYRKRSAEISGALEETEKLLDRLYIEDACEAYILDEAQTLGLEGSVEVRAKWRDSCWVPWEAELSLGGGAEGKKKLRAAMEAELGIPLERQNWHDGG